MLSAWAIGKKSVRAEGAGETERSEGPPRIAVTPAGVANGLRGLTDRNVARCRWWRVSPTVQGVEYSSDQGGKRFAIEGVHTCKSSMCPQCVRRWAHIRADEISHAVENHEKSGGHPLLITATVRHSRAHDLRLLHVLMRDAWGHMWSGREGQKLVELIGEKPETIRGFDWTYSVEKGWHPHYHVLAFVNEARFTEAEFEELFFKRWCECLQASLRRFRRMIDSVLWGNSCERKGCPCCSLPEDVPRAQRPECPHWRERARRLFGAKLIGKREVLTVALQQIRNLLRAFTWSSLEPSSAFSTGEDGVPRRVGLCLEFARDPKQVSRYLSNFGVFGSRLAGELAGATGKVGRRGGDGLMHYSLWEVGLIAASMPRAELAVDMLAREGCAPREASYLHHHMREAWSSLFWARKGMHVIIFSDREKLGLGPDPLGEGEEDADFDPSETRRLLVEIDAETWDAHAKPQKHGLIVTLEAAYTAGILESLPWVRRATWWQSLPATRDPPETGPPEPNEWCSGWQSIEAERAAEARGAAVVADALSRVTPDESLPDFVSVARARARSTLAAMGLVGVSEAERAELEARLEACGQLVRGKAMGS